MRTDIKITISEEFKSIEIEVPAALVIKDKPKGEHLTLSYIYIKDGDVYARIYNLEGDYKKHLQTPEKISLIPHGKWNSSKTTFKMRELTIQIND
jgi:hypothetical protein